MMDTFDNATDNAPRSLTGIFGDSTLAAHEDPALACCEDFPEDPTCAYLACFDEMTGMLTCECSALWALYEELSAGPFGRALEAQHEDNRRKLAAALPSTHRKLSIVECCQEERSKDDIQVCMDDLYLPSMGFSEEEHHGNDTSSFYPTPPCVEENDLLSGCLTAKDPFGSERIGCYNCETITSFQNYLGFQTCAGKGENGYCGEYANCVKEECDSACWDEAFDLQHCRLESDPFAPCDLICSVENVSVCLTFSVSELHFRRFIYLTDTHLLDLLFMRAKRQQTPISILLLLKRSKDASLILSLGALSSTPQTGLRSKHAV
jgi:hypothetical protein